MFFIIALLIMCISSKHPVISFSVGDIVDVNNSNFPSITTRGDIFNGFNGERFIETETGDHDDYNYLFHRMACFDHHSLKNYSFSPHIYLANQKSMGSMTKISGNRGGNTKLKYTDFGIDQKFIKNEYLYSVTELCLIIEEKSMKINLFDEDDFSVIYSKSNPKIIYNKTGILKFSKGNMTHYISSISTGECLYQVFVHTTETCSSLSQNSTSLDYSKQFFDSAIYKSQIITASGNRTLELEISNLGPNFIRDSWKTPIKIRKELFDKFSKNNILEIELHPLPKLPDVPKNMESSKVSFEVLKPGNIINIDTVNVDYLFTYDGYREYIEPPMMYQDYTNCYEHENEQLMPEATDSKYLYKMDMFQKMIKNENYGVDKEFLTDDFKCLKTTLCSELKGQKSDSPNFKIINLAQFSDDHKYNIIENENIFMIYRENTTTYHVRRIESGDCLFQALIYPASATKYEVDHCHVFPVQRGRIMSASKDMFLENRVKIFLASNQYNIFESLSYGKLNVLNVTLPLTNMLINKEMINVYLKKID